MRLLFDVLAIWCAGLSVYTFFLCGHDKSAARHDRWRIPEKRFFRLALAGGAYGLAAGMLCFRHKTKHASFVAVACLGIIVWTAVLFFAGVNAIM
jgi:uncharacterized membrane protein YsdA (DUF1294 family)